MYCVVLHCNCVQCSLSHCIGLHNCMHCTMPHFISQRFTALYPKALHCTELQCILSLSKALNAYYPAAQRLLQFTIVCNALHCTLSHCTAVTQLNLSLAAAGMHFILIFILSKIPIRILFLSLNYLSLSPHKYLSRYFSSRRNTYLYHLTNWYVALFLPHPCNFRMFCYPKT